MPNNKKDIKNPSGKIDLAYIDDLTGLYNRRYLNATLSKEISKAKRKDKKLSLLMLDYDDFKIINDTYGHLTGDRVLVEIARIFKKNVGQTNILARYAGDEFTVILPGKKLEESFNAAESLLQSASKCKTELRPGKRLSNVTLSIGLAIYPDDAGDAEELIDKADQALYSAKRSGKNRVSTMSDLVTEVHDRNLVINALPCKKFINREEELKILKKGYDSAKKGKRKFILIEGEQGVGKTRLMLELFDSDKKHQGLFLKGLQENIEQPYGVISEALNGLLDSMEASQTMEALASLSDIDKFALVSIVDRIKDLPVSYSKDKALLIKELKAENIFSALINFIKGLKLKTISILVDDILWVDKGSLQVLRWLLTEENVANGVFVAGALSKSLQRTQAAKAAPFILEFSSDDKIQKTLERIDLKPLSEKDVMELLKAVFPGLPLPADVGKKISFMSWGFPSNIEETIKYLLDSKIIYPQRGKWMLDNKRFNKLPLTLKKIFDKRILQLNGENREVLSKASVLGHDFNVDLLKFFYGKNEGQLLDVLDKLKDKGILQQSMVGGGALTFANNIFRENIYNGMGKKELQQLHKKVAELLEKYYKDRVNKVYGNLRYHLREAGEVGSLRSFADRHDLPPYIETGIAEEAEPSLEEIIEVPLSEKSIKLALKIVTTLRAAWINSQLYSPDNKTCVDSIENLNKCITKVLENDPTLTVTSSGYEVILNGQPIPRRKVSLMLSHLLASLLSDYGINSITFKRGLRKKELTALFSIIAKKQDYIETMGGFAKLFKEDNISNIKIDEVRYRKAADLAIRSKKVAELFKKAMPTSSAIGDIFSVSDKGLTLNEEILTDSKKTINSLSRAMKAISEQDVSEEQKSFMILESLYKSLGELDKKDKSWKKEDKKWLEKLFLSFEPPLRSKIIKEGAYYGRDVENLILDTLSGLGKKEIVKILNEGQSKTKMSPEEFDEFLKVILKSQQQKKLPYEEIKNLLEEGGIEKETSTKLLDEVFGKSFFDSLAGELIEGEKTEELEKKLVDNLRPLTEALIIKGDIKTVEKLARSLLARIDSDVFSQRILAIEGIGEMLEVLLEKEIFDISAIIGVELSEHLKAEENINVYVEFLKDLETMINVLIEKQNLSFLLIPLTALKEEASALSKRPHEFRSFAEETVGRIIRPKNINLLLLSFKGKAQEDYLTVVNFMLEFKDKALGALMELLFRKDDERLDPFDIYVKKRYIAFIIKKIGEKALQKLTSSLNDKRPFVVKNIIDVLGFMNDKKCLPYLEQAASYPDEEVQREAKILIKRLKGRAGKVK